nr:MAG TPA: hypothetical protein [Caudoviricetes sp.]
MIHAKIKNHRASIGAIGAIFRTDILNRVSFLFLRGVKWQIFF